MARMKNIHRLVRYDGKIDWTPATGEEINVEGYTLIYVKDVDFGVDKKTNALIEPQTGLSVSNGKNKPACINEFKERLEKIGKEKADETIRKAVEKYGQSPSYNRVSNNLVGMKV